MDSHSFAPGEEASKNKKRTRIGSSAADTWPATLETTAAPLGTAALCYRLSSLLDGAAVVSRSIALAVWDQSVGGSELTGGKIRRSEKSATYSLMAFRISAGT